LEGKKKEKKKRGGNPALGEGGHDGEEGTERGETNALYGGGRKEKIVAELGRGRRRRSRFFRKRLELLRKKCKRRLRDNSSLLKKGKKSGLILGEGVDTFYSRQEGGGKKRGKFPSSRKKEERWIYEKEKGISLLAHEKKGGDNYLLEKSVKKKTSAFLCKEKGRKKFLNRKKILTQKEEKKRKTYKHS